MYSWLGCIFKSLLHYRLWQIVRQNIVVRKEQFDCERWQSTFTFSFNKCKGTFEMSLSIWYSNKPLTTVFSLGMTFYDETILVA